MAYVNFVIPGNKEDLLKTSDVEYRVKNVLTVKDLASELRNARLLLRDEGGEFILTTFDTYYSILHHGETVTMDIVYRAYEDLHKGAIELNKAIGFLLEDKDSLNDEIQTKYSNILRMHLYLYTQIVLLIEQRNIAKNDQMIRGRKKSAKNDDDFTVDKKSVLLLLNNIMQREIALFWESQLVEENLINLVSGICYEFLQNPTTKKDKDEFIEIFNVLGYLIKEYNHGTTFVVRITQLVKIHEHLVQCLPKGVQQLVQAFNFKGLLHELVVELTEWQTDCAHQDSQGARHCSTVLSSLAALMPDLMIPEVESLNNYLYHDPPSLRISVIMVMVEVILNNLTSHDLSDELREFRDRLLAILIEHSEDNAALVRGKVFQQFARMQKESAIPLKFQQKIVEKVVEHLYDKGVISRRFAANCVTTFLSCNAFGANLRLSSMLKELEAKKKALVEAKEKFKEPNMEKLMELQAEWDKKVEKLKDVVKAELDKDKENRNDNEGKQIPIEQVHEIVRLYLLEDKFEEAFHVCRVALKDLEFLDKFKSIQTVDTSNELDFDLYMSVFYTIFFNISSVMEQLENRQFFNVTQDDYKRLDEICKHVEFLENCVAFLKTIDLAIDGMIELLETTSVGDMHEAISFFIAAYQFEVDRASDGILAMLRQIQRNEQERKDAIVEAFKSIYLVSETSNMFDHCTTIVNRLIVLLKTVPNNNIEDLQEIIADWCAKGTLDNAIIDMLWQYVTTRVSVTVEDECAAMELLRMAAIGRKTIITRNMQLVMSIGFGERGRKDMVFLGVCCRFLAVAFERVDINSEKPPSKIKADEQCFKDLVSILIEQFCEPIEFYHEALYGAIDFIYKMCAKPDAVCETLLAGVIPLIKKNEAIPDYIIIRLCQMCGFMALKHLIYMDDTVYKELKRRQNVRDGRKRDRMVVKKSKNSAGVGRKSMAATTASESLMTSTMAQDESTLEGAQAEDLDAEFILNVLENDTVTRSFFLAKIAPFIRNICERPDLFKSQEIQFAAVTALLRYMLISTKFCEDHIRLVFTILEKTTYPDVKSNVLIHLSDLLTRFPNVIEPWTPRIFQCLKDPVPHTRRATLFTLSSLILRDMIRAHSHIPEMASCLADEDEEVRALCKTFFVKLSHKENNLCNALPDIFTHLMGQDEDMDEDGLRSTMKLLFELTIENVKRIEHIVARFCSKFKMTEDNRHHKNISYCLTLIKYNDRALKKLIDEFATYKDLLHDSDIYANFRTIMQNSSKQLPGKMDLKPIVTELENLIKSVFEVNELPPPKSTKKRSRGRKTNRKKHCYDSE